MTAETLAQRLRNHVAPSRAEMAAYADEVAALVATDVEQIAERVYRMNGRAWYGRDLGEWGDAGSTIGRNESERDRWRQQAQVIVDA